jgi:hypothetical protein
VNAPSGRRDGPAERPFDAAGLPSPADEPVVQYSPGFRMGIESIGAGPAGSRGTDVRS